MSILRYLILTPFIILALILLVAILFPSITIEEEYEINAPLEKTWDIFHDTNYMKEWLTGFKGIKTIEEKPGMVGSRYQMVFEQGDGEMYMMEEITAYEPYKTFDFIIEHSAANTITKISFEEKNGKTLIRQNIETRSNSFFFRSILPLMKISMKKQNAESYANFKKLVESI